MRSRRYLIYLTKTFGSINKIVGRVKKTIQAKTLVDSSKRVSLTEEKFGHLTKMFCEINQTISLDEPFLSECISFIAIRFPSLKLLSLLNLSIFVFLPLRLISSSSLSPSHLLSPVMLFSALSVVVPSLPVPILHYPILNFLPSSFRSTLKAFTFFPLPCSPRSPLISFTRHAVLLSSSSLSVRPRLYLLLFRRPLSPPLSPLLFRAPSILPRPRWSRAPRQAPFTALNRNLLFCVSTACPISSFPHSLPNSLIPLCSAPTAIFPPVYPVPPSLRYFPYRTPFSLAPETEVLI